MTTRQLLKGALIGALYAALTLIAQPISFGLVQMRVSEAMCVLPYYSTAAVPGLFIGCLVANLVSGAPIWDVIFGSLATLIAAFLTAKMRKWGAPKYLVPLPAVAVNAVIVGLLLYHVYAVPVSLALCMLSVAAGQVIACYGFGTVLMIIIEKFKIKFD